MVSGDVSLNGDGYDGGGITASTWTDSAGHRVAYGKGDGNGEGILSGNGQQPSSHGISSSSSSYYACQYAEAAAKRQRTDISAPAPMATAGLTKPVGQGYASLLGGDASVASGIGLGGVLASDMSNTNSEAGIGGIGLDGLVCDAFGDNSGFGDDDIHGGSVCSVDAGSAWIDAVIGGESASASSSNLLYDT